MRRAPASELREQAHWRPVADDTKEGPVYRVFEALDELVTTVEEARGVPMTSSCVVPRGDVLELLDDIRDAIPAELDDAQDVLDHRDELMDTAQREARREREEAHTEAEQRVTVARRAAYERAVAEGHAEQARLVEQTQVVQIARAEATRIHDEVSAEVHRLRSECDTYVDRSEEHTSEL